MNSLVRSILSGYAQVFFSTNPWTGLLFMAATFVYPAQGLVGLLALLTANLMARLAGLPRGLIAEGYFAFNGLLVGLVLGVTYRPDLPFLVFFLASIALCVTLAAALHSLFLRFLGTPPLCTPFVLTSWLILTSATQFPELTYTVAPYEISSLAGVLPHSLEFFLRSLGATFFQFNLPAGLLIALGLALSSRQAFLMALIGLGSAISLQGYLGDSGFGLLGFNAALTGIALGGIWVVPGADSFLLAAVAGGLCAIITAATQVLFAPVDLPVLAFPFLVTTTAVLYALRQRTGNKPFAMVSVPAATPEANLKRHADSRTRQLSATLPGFFLPFRGAWKITQGIDGEFTHCGLWKHAWDFEVVDSEGKSYRTTGQVPEDFLAFGMPVCAAAAGRVVALRDDLPDNPIGQVDALENWGNHVVLEHLGGIFSGVYHLSPGTLEVQIGDSVRAGQVLGRVGSSGRSPVPHLHFQVQATPEPGAPTIPAEFLHYVLDRGKEQEYRTRGQPVRGEVLRQLIPGPHSSAGMFFPLGRSWKFQVRSGGQTWYETWISEIDFLGSRSLRSLERSVKVDLLLDGSSLLTWNFTGSGTSALGWFSLGVPRFPLAREELSWKDDLPADQLLGPISRFAHDLLQPFLSTAQLESSSHLTPTPGGESLLVTRLTPRGIFLRGRGSVLVSTRIHPLNGPYEIHVESEGETILSATTDFSEGVPR